MKSSVLDGTWHRELSLVRLDESESLKLGLLRAFGIALFWLYG